MDAADIARIADAEHLAKEIAEEEALGRAAAKRKRARATGEEKNYDEGTKCVQQID